MAGLFTTWKHRRTLPVAGAAVHGSVDVERRRDHMQQHTGQHVLSAAFLELYQMPTVSFHMGEDYCSIDLATPSVNPEQMVAAEKRANEIVFENRPVTRSLCFARGSGKAWPAQTAAGGARRTPADRGRGF